MALILMIMYQLKKEENVLFNSKLNLMKKSSNIFSDHNTWILLFLNVILLFSSYLINILSLWLLLKE